MLYIMKTVEGAMITFGIHAIVTKIGVFSTHSVKLSSNSLIWEASAQDFFIL